MDSRASNLAVEWRVQYIDSTGFVPVAALGDGWHPLSSTALSGAINDTRSPLLARPSGCAFVTRPRGWPR